MSGTCTHPCGTLEFAGTAHSGFGSVTFSYCTQCESTIYSGIPAGENGCILRWSVKNLETIWEVTCDKFPNCYCGQKMKMTPDV